MKIFHRLSQRLLMGLLALLTFRVMPAYAADPSVPGPAIAGFGTFIQRVSTLSNAAVNEPDFAFFVSLMFTFFVILLIVWTLFRYMFRAISMVEIVTNVVLIIMVQVLITTYTVWVDAAWSTTEGIAGSLQNGMIGSKDAFFAPQFISNILSNTTFATIDLINPIKVLTTGWNMIMLSVALVLLSVMSYVSVIWGFWGFTLAKITGMIFLPFLLYERMSFLFDGWFRFFIGFLVYYIVARLNVVLVACSLAIYFGVGIPFTQTLPQPVQLPFMSSLFDALGVFTFLFVGLLSLFSTGKFAATIVSGAGGGGLGSAVSGAARTVAKMALL